MKPVKKTTPDEWARENRSYPSSHGRPGPRDPFVTPYVVPFTRAFDVAYQIETYGARFDAAVFVTSSQMGKSEAVLDIIGQVMDQRPAPIMYVGPTKEFLHREIEPRLMDMIEQAPRLAERLARGKRLYKFRKLIGGVPIALAWAGSAAQVAGMAAKISLIDELDRMSASVQGEGDPFTLVEARGYSFRDRMKGAISTPLNGTVDIEVDEVSGLELWKAGSVEDIESPIWRLWQGGTRHHYCWPCPWCGDYFVPRFKQLHIPEDASPARALREAVVICPRCGGIIEEHHKSEMNRRGEYVAPGQSIDHNGIVTGPLPETTTLSFWASGLCSSTVSFGERAAAYVTAKQSGEQDKIQAAINTGFGELFAPGGGDVPEWQEVADLRRDYKRGELPAGVKMLTMTVDVQKNSLFYVIRGWGAYGTSWLIDHNELHGATTQKRVWDDLAELLLTPIESLPIRRAFIDSGYRPGKPFHLPVNMVYAFCRKYPRRTYPSKGRATLDGKPLVVKHHDVTQKGDIKKYGLDLILLDTDYGKSWVHERIRWPEDKPGAWLLPVDATDDYCKQIVSEARVKTPSNSVKWVPRSRNNHYLDCEAMQAALGHMLNVHLIRPDAHENPDDRKSGQRKKEKVRKQSASVPSVPVKIPEKSEKPASPRTAKTVSQALADRRAARKKRIAELTAGMS